MSKKENSRSRKTKLDNGLTKTNILLYLANNGESSFEDVRSYLRKEYNLGTPSRIHDHFKELGDGKEDKTEGKKKSYKKEKRLNLLALKQKPNPEYSSDRPYNYYYLKTGFDDFKRLFNYFKENNRITDFMGTKYYSVYIDSDDCKETYLIKIKKDGKPYNFVKYRDLEEHTTDPLEKLKDLNMSNEELDHGDEYIEIPDDAFREMNPIISLTDEDLEMFNKIMPLNSKAHLLKMVTIKTMMTESPSAMDFILNFENYKSPLLTAFKLQLMTLFDNAEILEDSEIFDDVNEFLINVIYDMLWSLTTSDIILGKSLERIATD